MRHAVAADAQLIVLRNGQIGDGPGNSAVAVLKRMNGDKPEMREGSIEALSSLIASQIEAFRHGNRFTEFRK